MSDKEISAIEKLTKKTPVHFDVGCFSSPALLPIEKASRYRTKIKSLRRESGRKMCLQGITRREECNVNFKMGWHLLICLKVLKAL